MSVPERSAQSIDGLFDEFSVPRDVAAFARAPQRMLIDGQWVEARTGQTIDVFEPSTGLKLTTMPRGSNADAERAVAAALKAHRDGRWSRMPPAGREEILLRLVSLLEADTEFLALLETIDNGKPLSASRMIDTPDAIRFARYMAGWATKLVGKTMTLSAPDCPLGLTLREPVGVVVAITPWNLPLNMAVQKVIPALVAGCAVILKPAEQTSLTALRLGQLALDAGVPPGVFNVVTGLGPEVGEPLVRHPEVSKITFTGSTIVGSHLGRIAMQNMARLTLELGGKSPMIVLPDCDLDRAAQGVIDGIFANAGQICCAASRLFVHSAIFDALLERVAARSRAMKVGPGLDPQTELGPLVSERQLQRVTDFIEQGRAEGAAINTGGRARSPGYFVEPTVLTQVDLGSVVNREEIFGPVLVARHFESDDEVLRLANDTRYGLAASIWSNDLRRIRSLAGELRAGTIWVNAHNPVDPALPFGGYKLSGFGREGGVEQLDAYLETKALWVAN
jgi:phenylacetaldehyde dehydrogenase